jgi:hypothetical protein
VAAAGLCAPAFAQSPDYALGPAHGTSPLIAEMPLFGWFLAENSELESACEPTQSPQDIGSFWGDGEFDRELVTRIQKSAVRISVLPTEQIEDVARTDLKFKSIALGKTFTGYSSNKMGICSGTLIAPDLVLTAGHCVSPRYWRDTKKVQIPVGVTTSGRRYVTPGELSRLLQVDVNYQLTYVASDDPSLPTLGVQSFQVPVAKLVAYSYDPYSIIDYAILRLKTAPEDMSSYALGMSKLDLSKPRSRLGLAIVQHPSGGHKKIATGSLHSTQSWRLDYANISTANGSSGAGIYNAAGHLIGIHLRGGCNIKGGTNKGMLLGAIERILRGLRPN